MATTNVSYGTNTAFANVSNLNSMANAAACALGAVDNSGALALDEWIDLKISLASSGVVATGTLLVYLIESPDNSGSSYTDGISPGGAPDVSGSIKNALLVKVLAANANSQIVRHRFRLGDVVSNMPKFWALVVTNSSGAALAASGHTCAYTPMVTTTA
jgi:hypothetical protein